MDKSNPNIVCIARCKTCGWEHRKQGKNDMSKLCAFHESLNSGHVAKAEMFTLETSIWIGQCLTCGVELNQEFFNTWEFATGWCSFHKTMCPDHITKMLEIKKG